MICRLCLNALDEQNAVLLFGGAGAGSAPTEADDSDGASGKVMPESYLVQLISIHLYLCLSRDDAISTCICTECCAQLESFHNFWKLVELKQTTLCSQFLEIDCDVNWSEDGGGDTQDPQLEPHPLILEPEFPEIWVNTEPKAATTPTTVNKFPCMFCEKSFKMRRYLEEHIATHTGDRPIACPYCEMAFRCRSNMYTHVKSKHTTQWLKAREERDAARSQNQGAVLVGEARLEPAEEPALVPAPAPAPAPATPAPVPASIPALVLTPLPAAAPLPSPPIIQQLPLPLSSIKSEPGEAINLTMAKTPPSASRGSRTRSSRRKTHSPKKVQHTEGSDASDEDLPQKRLKENELILANYNAVAAAVVAAAAAGGASVQPDSLQQRLCVSLLQQQQQQQDQLFAVMSAAATVVSSNSAAATTTTTTTTTRATDAMLGNPYSSPSAEAERLVLDKRRQDPPPPPATPLQAVIQAAPVSMICPNCGELPGQNHRCLSKPKYACDVCGKCFKMKRYLEEHFATHTGVKLHTCAFCPTEFRSKSNMYHHTKRKHKAEWERSRATRSAAKAQAQPGPAAV